MVPPVVPPPAAAIVPLTVKLSVDVAITPAVVTETVPVVAPFGTVTVSVVADAVTTVAGTPLNSTVLLAGVVLKLVPVMVTDVPGDPEIGFIPDKVTPALEAGMGVKPKVPLIVPV